MFMNTDMYILNPCGKESGSLTVLLIWNRIQKRHLESIVISCPFKDKLHAVQLKV